MSVAWVRDPGPSVLADPDPEPLDRFWHFDHFTFWSLKIGPSGQKLKAFKVPVFKTTA